MIRTVNCRDALSAFDIVEWEEKRLLFCYKKCLTREGSERVKATKMVALE